MLEFYSHFHCKKSILVKHIFRVFTGVLPDYFLLNSASTQNLRNLPNCNLEIETNVHNKQKIQVFFINT
jgi:hypothetical protein